MKLHAGAAEVRLTPPLGTHLDGSLMDRTAARIHDDLWAKALILEREDVRLGLLVADLVAVPAEVVAETRRRVSEALGIPPDRLLLAATHTHTGPAVAGVLNTVREEAYVAQLPARLTDAFCLASRRMQPAELAWAFGSCPSEVHNRRWRLRDGTVKTNPGALNPERVEPAGPSDPTLSALIVRSLQREPIALLATLALHYVGAPARDISADVFGAFATSLQRCAGARFTAMLANGCCGDINNVDVDRARPASPRPYHHIERVANVIAGETWRGWRALWEEAFTSTPILDAAERRLSFAPRRPTAAQVSEARDYLAAHEVADDPWRWTYAREYTRMVDLPASVSVPLQVLRIGDVPLVAMPGQPFAEIGLAIREQSPFARTAFIAQANDNIGYVAPDRAMDEGGYEVELKRTVIAPKGTADDWVRNAVELLEGLAEG